MSQAHEKGHYRELGGGLTLSTVKLITPEWLEKEWDQAEEHLAGLLNRTDLAGDVRAYLEDVLQEVNRQREVAAHKVMRPWSKVVPMKAGGSR